MPELGAEHLEFFQKVSQRNSSSFLLSVINLQPQSREDGGSTIQKSLDIKKNRTAAVFALLGAGAATLGAGALYALYTLLQNGVHVLSAVSGIDVDFSSVDDIASSSPETARKVSYQDFNEKSPERFLDTNASVIRLTEPSSEESGEEFEGTSIDSSDYDVWAAMTCEELKDAVKRVHYIIDVRTGNAIGDVSSVSLTNEELQAQLEVIDTVRLGKLLGGDTTCNFVV
jgi:hypothetical protein